MAQLETEKLQVGKPVTGRQLIGREKELAQIRELLLQGQSVVLIAPRRFGKTSLILEILTRLKKSGFFTSYNDLFVTPDLASLSRKITENILSNKKLEKAFKKVIGNISELFSNVELKQTIESFEFILKYSSQESDVWELFSDSIDFIDKFPKKYNKKIICAFDEFGDIGKFDGDKIVKLIRSKIQMQENATYIFSGSYESVMESLFIKQNAPFFRFARIINLGYIDRNEFKKYIVRILTKNNVAVNEKFSDDILRFTKGHPYYTQLVLQQILLNNITESGQKKISLKKILDELLVIENNYLEKQWEEISKSREIVHTLLAVVKYKKSVYSHIETKKINASRALKKLTGRGILWKEKSNYTLSDPLLELWIKERILQG